MLLDEVRQLLRELIQDTSALSAAVVHGVTDLCDVDDVPDADDAAVTGLVVEPLGNHVFLRIRLPAGKAPLPGAEHPVLDALVAGMIVRAVRALRASTRRWGEVRVPECLVGRSDEPQRDRVRERMRAFLEALHNAHGADAVLVSLRGEIVASSRPGNEMNRERVPFIVRRVAVEARRQGISHTEMTSSDFYARSFWFSACVVMFFSVPYSIDFVRHRVRMVCRELIPLLSMLDDPPPVGVQTAPIPE